MIVKNFIIAMMPIVIFIVGAIRIDNGLLTVGSLIAFLGLFDAAYIPVAEIMYFMSSKHSTKPYFDRNEEFLQNFSGDIPVQPEVENCDQPMINITNLSYKIDDKLILDGLNLDISKNGLYLLKGRNGCGKTTLFNLISSLYVPDGGAINVEGKVVNLTQENELFHLTLLENLFVNEPHLAKNLIEKFDVSHLDNRSVLNEDNMSGGEQRKVCIIRALLQNADIYLLDEPTEYLDKNARNEFVEHLVSIKNDKIIIVISHDTIFDEVCDRVINL